MGTSIEKVVASRPDLKRARLAALSNLVKSKKSGHLEKYFQLLTDFNFLAEKINHPEFGVQALIEDYDLIDDAEVSTNPEYDLEKAKALKLAQGALRLSANILLKDKTQLGGQLWGRMQCFELPEIQVMLEVAKQIKTTWLRPLTPSLVLPDRVLVHTLTGHSECIRSVIAITPDGKRIISSALDNALKVWNLETGEEIFILTGHTEPIIAIAITGDSKRAISGSMDNTIKVWNLEAGEEIFTLTGHTEPITAIVVTPNGKRVISGSFDETLKVWDLETGKELFTFTDYNGFEGAVAVTSDGNWVIYGSDHLEVRNLETGEVVFSLESCSAVSIAITLDGKRLISVLGDDGLELWNLETGEKISTFPSSTNRLKAVAITPDGKKVISGPSNHDTLTVRDVETGEEISSLTSYGRYTNQVRGILVVTPDSRRVIADASPNVNLIKVWDLATGQPLFTLTGHTQKITALAVHPDGKLVISGSQDKTLKVWNLEAEQELSALKSHTRSVNSIIVTPDGQRVITGALDNTLKVWNLETRQELFSIESDNVLLSSVALTRDGSCVISAVWDNTLQRWSCLKMWNLETGEELLTLVGHIDSINAIAVTPNGERIISGSQDNTLIVWNLETEEALTVAGHSNSTAFALNAIAVTPDGKRAISASTAYYALKDSYLKQLNVVAVDDYTINLLNEVDDYTLTIWDLETGEALFTYTGDARRVNAVAITPDGKQVIYGTESRSRDDVTLKVWDLETGEEPSDLPGHAESVNGVAVTSDGNRIISVSDDYTLKVWDWKKRKVIASFTGDDALKCCAIKPDGVTIVAGDNSGRVHFLRLEGMEASP